MMLALPAGVAELVDARDSKSRSLWEWGFESLRRHQAIRAPDRNFGEVRPMHLLAELEQRLEAEDSLFRAQLLREDIARLRRLESLARAHPDLAGFAKAGLSIGWTQGDFRTHEIKAPLEALLAAFHAYQTGGRSDDLERALRAAWADFDRERMEKLLGCL